MVYYILFNSVVGVYECEVTNEGIIIDLDSYQLIYFTSTDRLIIRLRKLGIFMNVFDVPSFLDVEARPSTYLLDALENLLKESVVIKEVE